MFIRFIVLRNVILLGRSSKSLQVSGEFTYKGYSVQLNFPGGDAHKFEGLFLRQTEGLRFTIREMSNDARPLDDLIQVPNHYELLRLIRSIARMVLRAIRNFAEVPELQETLPTELAPHENLKAELNIWSPEKSIDGDSWTAVLPMNSLYPVDFLTASEVSRSLASGANVVIYVEYWPDVIEALEETKELPPEMEFYVNAIGHLRQNNFRLAVLESVICLEIVLNQFLTNYLSITVSVPKKRIQKFLSPDIGFSARLSALLNLTLHESYLEQVDIDKVLQVVKWRNRVMHKTGRLPTNISKDIFIESVRAALSLARLLAERRDNLVATPELKKIQDALKEKADMLWPKVWLYRRHRVRVDFELFQKGKPRNYGEEIKILVDATIQNLRNRDPRFDPQKHLTIHFMKFPNKSLGWFKAGKLEMVE